LVLLLLLLKQERLLLDDFEWLATIARHRDPSC
jgi:hypothetical protein